MHKKLESYLFEKARQQQRQRDNVPSKDVKSGPEGEAYVLAMALSSKYSALQMNAQTKLRKEECASGMVQRSSVNDAV